MARYKQYDYSQSMILPVILEQQIIPGTIEFAIHYLVDNDIDVSILDRRFSNDNTGRRAYDPRVLLKIVLLAYSRGIIHSRKIERVCRENITFMALTCGQSPDHSTIAAFVSSMKDEIGPLFSDVLLTCEEMNLLGGTTFSLDGCKLPSNASKEWSGKRKTLIRKQQKLEKKVSELMDRQIHADKEESDPTDLARVEKQITRIRQNAERVRKFLDENEERKGRKGKEIKSNITDNESANMKTSHGTLQGFNGQALVNENQIIIGAEAFGSGPDYDHLEPMVEIAKRNLENIGYSADYFADKTFLADSNYHCESNLKYCDEERLDAYIPDVNFRKRDERFETQSRHKPKRDRFTTSDFTYDEVRDVFICPAGRELTLRAKRARTENRVHRRYVIKGDDCTSCQFFSKCLDKKRGGKRKHLHVRIEKKESFHNQMMEKIDTEEGRIKYGKRLGMVEPVFGNIRIHKGLDRFTLRGKSRSTSSGCYTA